MHQKRKFVRQTHVAKPITVFADATEGGAGDYVTATCTGHGMSDGDTLTIVGTDNYDAIEEIVYSSDDWFNFKATWNGDDGKGMWIKKLAGVGDGVLDEDAEQYKHAILYTDITTWVAGSLIVGLETSPDAGTTWYSLANGASLNSVSKQRLEVPAPLGKLVRPVYTLSGADIEMACTIHLELARTGG